MMHREAHAFIETALTMLPPRRQVVEFGGRFVNGRVRDLFVDAVSYVGVDLRPGVDVEVVADAAEYTPSEPPDTVVCCETLEHAANWRAIVTNAYHILCPDGVLLLTCAAPDRAPHSGIHGSTLEGGEHYGNVDPVDLASCLRDCGFRDYVLEYHAGRGDVYVVAMKL